MSGTRAGGKKTAKVIKEKYGKDYYEKIGTQGGRAKVPKGFAIDNRTWLQKLLRVKKAASKSGTKGGHISKRRKANSLDGSQGVVIGRDGETMLKYIEHEVKN